MIIRLFPPLLNFPPNLLCILNNFFCSPKRPQRAGTTARRSLGLRDGMHVSPRGTFHDGTTDFRPYGIGYLYKEKSDSPYSKSGRGRTVGYAIQDPETFHCTIGPKWFERGMRGVCVSRILFMWDYGEETQWEWRSFEVPVYYRNGEGVLIGERIKDPRNDTMGNRRPDYSQKNVPCLRELDRLNLWCDFRPQKPEGKLEV